MQDIEFDLNAREIVLSQPLFSGQCDFSVTQNPSCQNGGSILYSRAANPLSPMVGIGIIEIIGGNASKAALEMNRWLSQVKGDGATLAKWTSSNEQGNNIGIDIKQDYL
jgi:hypothetical protein